MSLRFATGNGVIVAGAAKPQHLTVIDAEYGDPGTCAVTVLTQTGTIDVLGVFTLGIDAVVAGLAATFDTDVGKTGRFPGAADAMAYLAVIV